MQRAFGMRGKLKNKPLKFKIITLTISILLIILVFITIAESLAPEPPLLELNQARVKIEIARKENAEQYALEYYRKAKRSWQLTQQTLIKENNKWSFNRNYQQVRNLARLTAEQAEIAKISSLKFQDSLHTVILIGLARVKNLISDYLDHYELVTTKPSIKKQLIQSEQLVREGEIARQTREYNRAIDCIDKAEKSILNVDREMSRVISEYFSHIPQWEQWVAASIQESADSQKVVLIVNKMEHYLEVFRDGIQVAQFDIEMGSNWIGDKEYRGDKATPEGHYLVVKKREKRKTIYYKALELNYPNVYDEERFNRNLESGRLPWNAEIGGSIEIHGEGGTGSNWTDGCIALKNSDMDSLFTLVEEGTPVTIVGTLQKKIPRASR
jgi:hypothetical protein